MNQKPDSNLCFGQRGSHVPQSDDIPIRFPRRRFLQASALGLAGTRLSGFGPISQKAEQAAPKSVPDSNPPTPGPLLPDPKSMGNIQYINPNPPEFKLPEYPGEYYDALVPATLDLSERARLAVHAMTSMTNPNLEYEVYFPVAHMAQPPAMYVSQSDLDSWGKFRESTTLMRIICGSKENLHVDRTWMEVQIKSQGSDGIIYSPTTGRDWTMYSGVMPEGGATASENPTKQYCLLSFGTARSLAAMCMWAQMDPDGPWEEAARKLARGYAALMINKGADKSFLFSAWTYPGRPVQKLARSIMEESIYTAGNEAWVAQYLVMYDRALHDPNASKLAERIMNFNIFERQVNEPDGRFHESPEVGDGPAKGQYAHFHNHATNIIASIYVHLQTGNQGLLDQAIKSYEYGKRKGDPLVGFFPEVCSDYKQIGSRPCETCATADMVVAALMLAKLGHDRCWDEADRWVRNQLAENQLTQVDWLSDGHLDDSRSKVPAGFFDPKHCTTDRVGERTLGVFAGWSGPNDWVSQEDWLGDNKENILVTVQNCCMASGTRAMFATWRDMLSYEQGRLKVNLLFNRASKWADIDSYIPYLGRVELRIKEPVELEVRLPEWVKTGEAQCEVDGQKRNLGHEGRYAQIGKLRQGETVAVSFPISERTERRTIEGSDYTFVLRGNDVVAVDPVGKYLPLYQRNHYRTGQPLYQKVQRFVSSQQFAWW